jgi:tetratricopeptide (TPR) repeat protein
MGGQLPYQPLVHALGRRLEQEAAPEGLLGITWLSELSRLLPELRERYPHLPVAPGDEPTARIRLFEAVTRLVQALGERAPLVLFIDDVQWADAASLDVLHYAGQRWSERGTPLLLLLAVRSEALATTGSLRAWLTGLHHNLPVMELPLAPLTRDETLHLLASMETTNQTRNSGDLGRLNAMGQWLFRETHGQPFYLVETLRILLERQILTLRGSSGAQELEFDLTALAAAQQHGVLPPGIRRLILSQLEQLTTTGHALVRASTILGQRASFDLLCRVADLQEAEALAALADALGHGLLREASEEDGRGTRAWVGSYLFAHDKIREVIATEMGEAQRRLLHRRTLSVLEALDRPAAELAHHALEAGLMERAVHFSLAAGDEAAHLLADAEASLHYTQALEALSQLPKTADTRDLRIETTLKLVQVSWATVKVEHTLARLAEAENLAREVPDPDPRRLAHLHYWIGVVYGTRNTMHQARAYAERVLGEAQALEDKELVALASLQLSRALVLQGRYGPVEGLLTPIIPILERTARWLDWTFALGYLGTALAGRGHVALGVAQGQRAVERARRTEEMKSGLGVMARHFLSVIYLYGGDPSRMLSENEQIAEEAQQLDNWLLAYWAYGFRAWAQARLGKYEEAMESLAGAQAASQRLGERIMGQDLLEAVTAELLLLTGQVEAALAHAQAAIELSREEVGGVLGEGIAQRVWGQALGRLARWEEAETHLAKSWQLLLSGENRLEAAHTQVAWGLLCRDRGDLVSAQRHLEQAAAQFEASGLTRELETMQSHLAQMGPG